MVGKMVSLNLKLERRQPCLTPSQLVLIIMSTAIFLSTLSLFHAITYSECSSDDATSTPTLRELFISSSPASVVLASSLASQQSYGLFNDIPDQSWELMREQAHVHHENQFIQKKSSTISKTQNNTPIVEFLANTVQVRMIGR
jgi:hypothetical protein